MPIYVVSHKDAPMPTNSLYKKIAVGDGKTFSCDIRDDSGNNIAHLNKYYCELTAYYHIWKNENPEYVGICHYRRYFNLIPNTRYKDGWIEIPYDENSTEILENLEQEKRLLKLLNTYDLIVPRSWPTPFSLRESYLETQNSKEWDIFLEEIDSLYGKSGHPLRVENRNIYGNMLICKNDLFQLYCEQLFSIIDKVFNKVGIYPDQPGIRYQHYRYPGYLAERFLTAFIYFHRLRTFEAQIFSFDNL